MPEVADDVADGAEVELRLARRIARRVVHDDPEHVGVDAKLPARRPGEQRRVVHEHQPGLDPALRRHQRRPGRLQRGEHARMRWPALRQDRRLDRRDRGGQPGAADRPQLVGERRARTAGEADIGQQHDVDAVGGAQYGVLEPPDMGEDPSSGIIAALL